ncbi:uncharacterized protein SAPINGB_P002590 [Magnusiomyces paraingens]|uniref:Mitochondrial import inner membrane translocase subunit TIM44 n=1 Tax=Magnusiomyces paraingens TaxID=2606893 RepID=A0A5E8BEY1_9ASCO|nr:uncharacterized protein SAPINGB_P002590 [Saprochaete ingens]VVT50079.1 unnamed protein product [Saprochaete ingens]
MLRLSNMSRSRGMAMASRSLASSRQALAYPALTSARTFSQSSFQRSSADEQKKQEKQEKQEQQKKSSPSDDDANLDKTPLQVFFDTFKREWQKSEELQSNIKALQDETGRMAESAAYKKAKEALEKAQEGTSSATSATSATLKKASKVVGQVAHEAWESPVIKTTRNVASKTADVVEKATEPIRETQAYKTVRDVIDDGSSMRYGGYEDKETRRLRRQQEAEKELEEELRTGKKKAKPVKEDIMAGQAVVLHENPEPVETWRDSWAKWKAESAAGKKLSDLQTAYEETDNGFISTIRTIGDKIGGFFEETENARVVRMFKELDPEFNQEKFLKEIRGYILPEVLDAYVKGDEETLKLWLSEAPFNIWAASTKQYKEAGLYSASRVLDIRGVDILQAKLLPPQDVPVFVIGCRAQEVHMYKNIKTDEIAAGMEDHIQQSTYAMVITRIPENIEDPETKGWQILELVRGQTRDWT